MVLQHEQQHNETMLQAIELAQLGTAPGLTAAPGPRRRAATPGSRRSRCPAARSCSAHPADRFAFDNERPRPRVDMRPFRIGRTPVTNATFLTFPEGGGYQRREWWSDEGWSWKEDYDITHPGGGPPVRRVAAVARGRLGAAAPRRAGGPCLLVRGGRPRQIPRRSAPDRAGVGEGGGLGPGAQGRAAYPWGESPRSPATAAPTSTRRASARSRPARCPPAPRPAARSGCSATRGSGPRPTSTATPASRAHPYREYSEVFFGDDYRVLRGGSWATRSTWRRTTFRNWDLPQRRQIFSGVRLAWDAS